MDKNTGKEKTKKKIISQEDIMAVLDSCYQKCLDGIPIVSPSVGDLAQDYIGKYKNRQDAAKAMINNQIIKCTASGFITGLGGFITLPVAIPANVGSVIYVQMRMIACLAYMGGFDMKSDQTKTFIYACLAGISVSDICKQAGIRFATKLSAKMIEKIPGQVLTKINQKVGFRLVAKMGEKGIINLGKMLPVVGAVIGGGGDLAGSKIIANRAYKWFIENEYIDKVNEEMVVDIDVEAVE